MRIWKISIKDSCKRTNLTQKSNLTNQNSNKSSSHKVILIDLSPLNNCKLTKIKKEIFLNFMTHSKLIIRNPQIGDFTSKRIMDSQKEKINSWPKKREKFKKNRGLSSYKWKKNPKSLLEIFREPTINSKREEKS